MWARFEAWMTGIPFDWSARLLPPATEAEIAALVEAAGGWLPDDYIESLRCHAGNVIATSRHGRPYPVRFFDTVTWLAPPLVLAERAHLGEHYQVPASPHSAICPTVRAAFYDQGWLPIARGDEDRILYWCLDLVPADPAFRGQILVVDTKDGDRGYVHASYRAFFANEVLARIADGGPDPIDLEDHGVIRVGPM
jgi:cell wall assembly regulator SMI1